jgi:hypothetical protein
VKRSGEARELGIVPCGADQSNSNRETIASESAYAAKYRDLPLVALRGRLPLDLTRPHFQHARNYQEGVIRTSAVATSGAA